MSRPANAEYPCYWMYKDQRNQWRWTYFASNAEEIGVSSESYVNKQDCRRGVDIMRASSDSKIYEQA
jgi:uncharacterized protein YegP (UPF0339 family)